MTEKTELTFVEIPCHTSEKANTYTVSDKTVATIRTAMLQIDISNEISDALLTRWYVAPTIINTFLEQYDLTGKKVIPFATSSGSGMGNTNKELADSCKGAILLEGKRFESSASEADLKVWAEKF